MKWNLTGKRRMDKERDTLFSTVLCAYVWTCILRYGHVRSSMVITCSYTAMYGCVWLWSGHVSSCMILVRGAPKWPTGSGKVFGHSKQLSLNKFFDPSTPSMRKVDDGEKKNKKK